MNTIELLCLTEQKDKQQSAKHRHKTKDRIGQYIEVTVLRVVEDK
jgi:hypothetical protein